MAISVICAWIAAIALVLTASKFIAKKNKAVNRLFRRLHIPAGIVLIAAGLIHGLLAGNSQGAAWGEIVFASELFSPNLGTLCFVLSVALGLNYCLRRKLGRYWLRIHRILTVIITAVLVLHVAQAGITLPELFGKNGAQQSAAEMTDGSSAGLTGQMEISFSGAALKDGTYEGSAEGYKSTIKVSVKVEDGAVTAVDILSQSETPSFWNRAKALIDTLLSEQSLKVDAVSGATYSSKGILCAVYDALKEAVCGGELQITIPETKGGRH